MDPEVRQRSLRVLFAARNDVHLCRDVESFCHASSSDAIEYRDRVRHAAFNLVNNTTVGFEVVRDDDATLTAQTLTGRIRDEAHARQERFDAMLKEKYDALNDQTFNAIVRCRRCGSGEIVYEEKQTRSADEGATVYCSCATCKNRWVMR